MKEILKKYFGFDEFRPYQEEIISTVLEGRDSFVLMPTGGGKSLCFQIPALKFEGLTLVISPLIALMKDQVDGLKANGVAAEALNSSLSQDDIYDICQRLERNEIKILYIAPERLGVWDFKEFLQNLKISLVAIDEAHCISEWGHDFRPDYRNMQSIKQDFNAPVIALTATATENVRVDICKQLSLENPKHFVSSFDRPNLNINVKAKQEHFEKIVDLLNKYKNESAIIYCYSRKETEKLSKSLKEKGFKTAPYHAGLTAVTRRKNQDAFVKDKVDVIIATIAFGMGIDKPDVRLIIHTTFPKTLEGYYQEIGRAGRDGLDSECVVFYSHGDKRKHQFFINMMEFENEKERAEVKMQDVINYCELLTCRRDFILKYFDDNYGKDTCNNCDRCLSDDEKFDATVIVQKILSAVIELNSRFGKSYIIDVLRGSKSKKIIDWNHHRLHVYGIVEDFSKEDLQQIIDTLVSVNLLDRDRGKFPILSVTQKGYDFLRERESINLTRPEVRTAKSIKPKKLMHDHGDYDVALFEELRVLRRDISDRNAIAPFMVFGDVSLKAMAKFRPKNNAEFLKIHGVGESKLKRFGEAFLEVING